MKLHLEKHLNCKEALIIILNSNNIRTRSELDQFCGNQGRKKIYKEVQKKSSIHWNSINNPEANVRAHYETIIEGYAKFNKQKANKLLKELF